MPSTGNVLPGTGENNAGIGATAWSSPGNVTADDTNDATCAAAASSQYLVARNFNFSAIPDGVAIDGVLVRVEASEHSGGTEALRAQLQDEAGALVGTAKTAANEGNISGTAKAVYTYGSASDLWGAALTAAIVKDPDFGVRFWFLTAHDVRIDFVTMDVTYTEGPITKTASDRLGARSGDALGAALVASARPDRLGARGGDALVQALLQSRPTDQLGARAADALRTLLVTAAGTPDRLGARTGDASRLALVLVRQDRGGIALPRGSTG